MLFSSIVFLLYFLPVVLFLYYLCFFSRKLQNLILLSVSLFFYAWGEVKFVFIMLLSIIVNYFIGILVDKFRSHPIKEYIILGIMFVYNIGILIIFKYSAFIIGNINELKGYNLKVPNVTIPLGISFFTFQIISYVIDVYRGNAAVQKNIFYLGLYISFFPQLIAGPIVRYNTIENEIRNRKETKYKFGVGFCRFITGLSKKVLISNSMAVIVDNIFVMNSQFNIPVTLAWIGSIAYTFQIYYDFSGYSDMAIGLGFMFGFHFDENFNYPYISKSITEFWRRWHISLGMWFRDYVYFPMGGSRVDSTEKLVRNLFIVWLLTGMWHGAGWNFILWGLLNFVFISIEKIMEFEEWNIPNAVKHIYALFIINLGWVLFRSPDLVQAGKYISCMFGIRNRGHFLSSYAYMFLKENVVFFIAAVILSTPICRKCNKFLVENARYSNVFQGAYPIVIVGMLFICLCYLAKGSYNPFIYFNF